MTSTEKKLKLKTELLPIYEEALKKIDRKHMSNAKWFLAANFLDYGICRAASFVIHLSIWRTRWLKAGVKAGKCENFPYYIARPPLYAKNKKELKESLKARIEFLKQL